jgi:hypothetical protein
MLHRHCALFALVCVASLPATAAAAQYDDYGVTDAEYLTDEDWDLFAPRRSLRFALAKLPDSGDSSVKINDNQFGFAGTTEGEAEYDSAYRAQVGVYWADPDITSLSFGTGLTLSTQSDDPATQTQLGVFIEPGISVSISERFRVELGVPLGLGLSRYSDSDNDISGNGYFSEFGGTIRPIVLVGRLLLQAEVGWLSTQTNYEGLSISLPGATMDVDSETRGVFFAAGLGVRF